jgi:hypothetical protein
MAENNEYGTNSIYQTAACLERNFQYKRLGYDPFTGKVEFIFEWSEALDKVVHEFVNGTLTVNCEKFIAAWQRLRRAIDEKEGRNGQGNGKKFRR